MKTKLRPRPCPLCSSRDDSSVFAQADFDLSRLGAFAFASRKVPEHMHFRLILCPRCGVLYSHPILPLQKLSKAYQEAAYDSSEESHYAARTYGRCLSRILKNLPDREGALDIGTGDGAFLEELLRMGFTRVAGVEPSRAPVAASRPPIRPLIRQGPFRRGNFRASSLRLVTCFQTLEHLADPLALCRAAHALLKPGGAFFSVCHNRRALSARILGMKSPIFDIEHLQLFSFSSAKFMLEKAGFTRVEVRPLLNSYPLHYWLKLLPLPRAWKGAFLSRLKTTSLGRLPIPLPAGNMAVVGYKK